MKIGYARVSRKDQNLNLQLDALRAAGCDEIFKDKLSGASTQRPGLGRAMARLRPGDEFVVWKFDRYGRTMLESMLLALDLERRGISFRSLTESFDTKTAIGKGVMAFVAAIAEDERERLIRRTREGMAAARRRGVVIGRPRKLSAKQIEQARMRIERGDETATRAAARLSVDVSTLRRALRRKGG